MQNPVIDGIKNKFWYNKKRQLHRLDGPAVELVNGDRVWSVDGKFHRLDGPAINYTNGYKEYWIEGIKYSEEEFNQKIIKMKE